MDEIIGCVDLDRIINPLYDHFIERIEPSPVYVRKEDEAKLYWEDFCMTIRIQFIRHLKKKMTATEKTM